MKNNLSI